MSKPVRQFGKETQFFLNDGTIAAGGFLYQYASGTTTPVNTYTTNDLVSPIANSNPMTLDSAGRLSQDVYITQAMKFVLKDSNSVTLWTIDTVSATDQLWTLSAKTTNYTTTAADNYKLITVDATAGNITVTLLAAATAGAGYIQAIKKTDSSANTVTIDPNSSETMDTGHTTLTLRSQGSTALFISDGTNWKLINLYYGEAIVDGSIFTINDAVNNANTDVLTLVHTTSGTPASGIGSSILLRTESADESPSDAGRIIVINDDVTAGSEDTAFLFQTRAAGAALATTFKLIATTGFATIFTHANTANRTVTFANYDMNFRHGAFRATDAGTSVANATAVKMTCETETFDAESWYDNLTDFRYTPLVSGYYSIRGHVKCSTLDAQGTLKAMIYKNGSVYQESGGRGNAAGVELHSNVEALVYLNGSTDYVELFGYQDGTGVETITAEFWGQHIPSS